jgi:hypothetical protein
MLTGLVEDKTSPGLRRGFAHVAWRPLYFGLSLVVCLIAVAGFVPGMVRRHLSGDLPSDAIIHVHVVVYWLWLALFTGQTLLIALGRRRAHARTGRWLGAYGVLMFATGLGVTANRFMKQVQAGDLQLARHANLAPFVDMLMFPWFFGAALYFRHKPAIHKRLMVVTSALVVYPAITRIQCAFVQQHTLGFLLIWSSPILIGILHDYWTERRLIHPAYVVGLLTLSVLSRRAAWADTQLWGAFCQWLALHINQPR